MTSGFLLACGLALGMIASDESDPSMEDELTQQPSESTARLRWRRQTFGGLQFWSDVYYNQEYRIQQHCLTGEHRLLDGKFKRLTTGDEPTCRSALQRLLAGREKPETPKEVVLLLHGIIRTHHSMRGLAKYLERHGYGTYTVAYPSTRLAIERHAENLRRIVDGLDEADTIHLVGFSMGGLVIRSFLGDSPHPRIGRVVMLGTPNQGAMKADWWHRNWGYRKVMGPAGQQLQTGACGITTQLPQTLPVEFAVVAGARGNGRGYSWILEGDDDGTVSVASTRLAGARDFTTVRSLHTFLMTNRHAQEMVLRFLNEGSLRGEEHRSPIPLETRDETDEK
ncbi:Alpha/beta hydrolase family protein [Planctomycetes bacterium Pan216]|uniref:Alpha/beta hydrolase family protein n=1 Tax=Kolteria novifilia TaxID=2527975 RepID=A0A518AYJ6_9BACT|nr:Alpha/beta hydrolase family protein [Planctomycetes bacterium Pan216]